jgi:hypothetical protein
VHVNAVIPAALDESMDGVERQHEFVEGQVGVHGKAEIVNLSLLWHRQQLLLHAKFISILSHVPNLELSIAYVGFELGYIVGLRELHMVDLGNYLRNFVFSEDLLFDLGVVIGNVVGQSFNSLALLEFLQHACK